VGKQRLIRCEVIVMSIFNKLP